jgi:hypothetical protein
MDIRITQLPAIGWASLKTFSVSFYDAINAVSFLFDEIPMLTASRWDDWVTGDRLRKWNEENTALARNLKRQMEEQTKSNKPAAKSSLGKRKGDASARGSEERGVGKKRARDGDAESVSDRHPTFTHLPPSLSPWITLIHSRSSVPRLGDGCQKSTICALFLLPALSTASRKRCSCFLLLFTEVLPSTHLRRQLSHGFILLY